MHWFNKDTISCKLESFFRDALRNWPSKDSSLFNVSDALSPSTAASRQACHYRRKRWTEKITHTTWISVTFSVLFIFTRISLVLPRLVLNLSHPAKSWFDWPWFDWYRLALSIKQTITLIKLKFSTLIAVYNTLSWR